VESSDLSGDIREHSPSRVIYRVAVAERFHVTSSRNRESIMRNGLDWRNMEAARGIAGSMAPEQQGCFVCRDDEVDWFVEMNNTGGPVDVWAVSGVDEDSLVQSPEGYEYVAAPIPPDRLTLMRIDIGPVDIEAADAGGGGLTGSISITFRPGYEPDPK
jgi:hypothetical protein